MTFKRIRTPGIAHLAYLIGNKGEGTVVDPPRNVDEYITLARKHKLTIKCMIETHRQKDSRPIVGLMTDDDSRVAETMGTAVSVGALGHRLLRRRGLATADPKPMNPVGLEGGAVLFGTGMALSGYCPATAGAAAGSGRREAVRRMTGMRAAAAVFVATYPRLKQALEVGTLGHVNLRGANPARPAPPLLDVAVRTHAAPATGLQPGLHE